MSEIFNAAYVMVAVVLLFGAAVFVHEFGHFWMARRRGLKVEAFAIGFGPKILSWTRDGIEYSWRWIPAGGFVKLPQMITSEALEGESSSGGEKIPAAPPLSKILVAVAGPLMNVIFGFAIAALLYFVGLPVAVNPSIIGHVEPGSDEYNKGIREGDQIVMVDGRMAKSWQEVQEITALARTNVLAVVTERNGLRATNYLTAKINDTVGLKVLDLEPRDHPVVSLVEKGSPAEKAGLQERDKFISFGGVPVVGQQQLVDLIRKRGGVPTQVVVERDKKLLALTVTPRFIDNEKKIGRIGVGLTGDSTVVYRVMKPGPKPWEMIADVWNRTLSVFNALLHSKQTGVGPKDLSGPVGIIAMLAIWVNTDYRLALYFLVLLNVNLAVLNLLPVPVLDGGHVLLSIIEKIRRRPLSARIQEYATTAFAVLLISFMLYVTFFDIRRLPFFKLMFKRDVQIEEVESPAENSKPAAAPEPVK
jgi:regulator of sigma E protease